MRKASVVILAFLLAVVVALTAAARRKDKAVVAEDRRISEQQRALHALNRLTFGPRPGDVQAILAMGVDKWIDLQLHPDKINDSALEARLAPFRTLRMDQRAMVENFPPPQLVKAVADGKIPLPSDPERRAIYEAQIERLHEREERRQEAKTPAQTVVQMKSGQTAPASDEMAGLEQARRQERLQARQRADELLIMPPDQRFHTLLRMADHERRPLAELPPAEREQLLAGFTPQQRETAIALVNPQMVVITELQQAKLLRAVYSERQLQEVMTDFWFNHFNVFIGKGPDRHLITGYERDVIRPHALGKFKDLLLATAKSPAMLFYLDNWLSVGPESEFARNGPERPNQNRAVGMRPRTGLRRGSLRNGGVRPPRPAGTPRKAPANKQRAGLNENYARELMELHTLGVNGGYTQKDVTEVARVFTGWTLQEPRKAGEFKFNDRMHEPGTKVVLGHKIKNHGENEGLQVLEILARHPSTAHFICTKLAQRFVADDPPTELVDRMAKRFNDSDGDIHAVLATMFKSPEFWSPQIYRVKVKTPLEFVVSAVRATGTDVADAMPLAQTLNRMGMPLYGAQAPTGYPMKADTWVNSAALLNRMNFALAMAASRFPGVKPEIQQLLIASQAGRQMKTDSGPPGADSHADVLADLENLLLGGNVSRQTHDAIGKQMEDSQGIGKASATAGPSADVGLIAGLLLGSPEFQRR